MTVPRRRRWLCELTKSKRRVRIVRLVLVPLAIALAILGLTGRLEPPAVLVSNLLILALLRLDARPRKGPRTRRESEERHAKKLRRKANRRRHTNAG